MSGCTCTFAEPRRYGVSVAGITSRYVTYLDFIEDDTEFDPACPFHGEGGSMVAEIRATGSVGAIAREGSEQ